MKKHALNVDSLKVQTFETMLDARARGVNDEEGAGFYGTRVTRCGSECNNCTYTDCHPDQRTEADCIC